MTHSTETERAELAALANAVGTIAYRYAPTSEHRAVLSGAASVIRRLASQDQKPVAWQQYINGKWCNLPEDWSEEECASMPAGKVFRALCLSPQPAAGWGEALRSLMKVGKIMAVCESCSSSYPEGCGHYDLDDLRETPDGAWVCENCWDDSGDKPIWEDLSHVESLRATPAATKPEPAVLTYTNYRGETSVRRIIPRSVRYGSTEWHPEPQWLLLAHDTEKNTDREFALKDFGPAATKSADAGGGVNVSRDMLLTLISVLDCALGDTDPSIDQDYTDDEVKRDYPVFWVCQQLSALSHQPAPVAANANASAEARLREALMLAKGRLKWAAYANPGVREEKGRDLVFSWVNEIDAALSAHPHASDCDKQGRELTKQERDCVEAALFASGTVVDETTKSEGQPDRDCSDTSRSNCEPERCPSDRTADVTKLLEFVVRADSDNTWSSNRRAIVGDARALLDAYGMWRR